MGFEGRSLRIPTHIRSIRRLGVKGNKAGQKSRWWKAITLYKMYIFIALFLYISVASTSNISSYYNKSKNTIYKLMELSGLSKLSSIFMY
jgi:hypothetical protein